MSTPDQPVPTSEYPEPTQEDRDARFASVVWFRDQRATGAFEQYQGMFVAILGEQIIDADRDAEVLGHRLEARSDALPLNRVVLQYVHRPEDWNWK
ncbi:MAG: hypothetical protein L0241_18725 [Planctomycetia bacterium]|nr:hypothetical protein [Planctomycetia bacterium]